MTSNIQLLCTKPLLCSISQTRQSTIFRFVFDVRAIDSLLTRNRHFATQIMDLSRSSSADETSETAPHDENPNSTDGPSHGSVNGFNEFSDETSDEAADEAAGGAADEAAEQATDRAADRTAAQILGDTLNILPGNVLQEVLEAISQIMQRNLPQDIPENMSHEVPAYDDWEFKSENSEDSVKDNNDTDDVDSLADDEYWEENNEADEWLAEFGSSQDLYPNIYMVEPHQGIVETPCIDPSLTHYLLRLPLEIRNLIYEHCFDIDIPGDIDGPEETFAPFFDRWGIELKRITLDSSNHDLKYFLSSAVLRTSRQMRYEAMPILFRSRVCTTDWLPAIPKFKEFLGQEGCAMISYLDVWDALDLQGRHNNTYGDILKSIWHFPCLQHLRIVVAFGPNDVGVPWEQRTSSWFTDDDWNEVHADLTPPVVPKLRIEDLDKHWPEHIILKSIKTQHFTLAAAFSEHYWEFDRGYGALPSICKSMRPDSAAAAPTMLPNPSTVVPLDPAHTFERVEHPLADQSLLVISPASESQITPNLDSPGSEDIKGCYRSVIPLFNFLRHHFLLFLLATMEDGSYLEEPARHKALGRFNTFPIAPISTGSIMPACALCYLAGKHCGYHTEPDYPSYPSELEEDNVENTSFSEEFKQLSYYEYRNTCFHLANVARDTPELDQVFTVCNYLGWDEVSDLECLEALNRATIHGWEGLRFDKREALPWDVCYHELRDVLDRIFDHYNWQAKQLRGH
ncbi:hypothetical protein BT63DRAFT_458259 [Microthyrium microscopicum]|uniref:Uncharacterized protein n=1 Tax=Microthyrium microscopicum TaxID=703497 RepID=A0A6A6U0S4_9PEZI|nr:hypothetical protein BT63DRAFT_458259 [Microthyrium microscopicum]